MDPHATLFGAVTDDYGDLRPPLPRVALGWLVPNSATVKDVLDLGPLVEHMRASPVLTPWVYAVEPDERMLQVLQTVCPAALGLTGCAEAIPLQDYRVDVVVADAWWTPGTPDGPHQPG
jgi:hypothetical protein